MMYAYDAVDQVTSDNGAAVAYDANGNRTSASSVIGANNPL